MIAALISIAVCIAVIVCVERALRTRYAQSVNNKRPDWWAQSIDSPGLRRSVHEVDDNGPLDLTFAQRERK